ncbi:MAG: nitronate monooxygenase family protein [Actinomycetota bacterium]|nr:nitronate monooxygenase family protein [Actinomycetota bacterium]
MFKTRVTELLGIENPIIGGCMQWLSGPEFTAAVCNAGALGIMSSAMYQDPEEFRDALRGLKGLTDRPFAVNLNLFPALRPVDNQIYLDIILEEGGAKAVETSGYRPPPDLISGLKDAGIVVMHKCVSVQHAVTARNMGADAVTVFGSEGGGHIGYYGLTTLSMVPRAVDQLDIPVIAAGGIADGRGLMAALSLGAEAALLGTRLLLTEECTLHDELKRRLLEAGEMDTLPILGSVHNPLRVMKNRASLEVAEMEAQGASFDDIIKIVAGVITRRMYGEGDADSGVIPCSQSVGIIHELKPVAQVIGGIMREAEAVARRLAPEDMKSTSGWR